MTPTDRDAWNGFVLARNGSFLQSAEWAELQEKLGRRTFRLRGETPALLVRYPLPRGLHYLYAPFGPLIDAERFTVPALRTFAGAARELAVGERPLFIRIEPTLGEAPAYCRALRAAGFAPAPQAQPRETLILDLAKPEEELLGAMEHDTRYAVRAAERRGVVVRRHRDPDDRHAAFEAFWALFEATNVRHGLARYPRAYYEGVAALAGACRSEVHLAFLGDQPIGAALFVYFGSAVTYLHAASAPGFGKYNAPTALLWGAARAARAEGFRTLDLWGISRKNPRWEGITAFKKSFGGREVRRLGTWDYPVRRWLYAAYRMVTRVRRGG